MFSIFIHLMKVALRTYIDGMLQYADDTGIDVEEVIEVLRSYVRDYDKGASNDQ
jgi:hypothetical protein